MKQKQNTNFPDLFLLPKKLIDNINDEKIQIAEFFIKFIIYNFY